MKIIIVYFTVCCTNRKILTTSLQVQNINEINKRNTSAWNYFQFLIICKGTLPVNLHHIEEACHSEPSFWTTPAHPQSNRPSWPGRGWHRGAGRRPTRRGCRLRGLRRDWTRNCCCCCHSRTSHSQRRTSSPSCRRFVGFWILFHWTWGL